VYGGRHRAIAGRPILVATLLCLVAGLAIAPAPEVRAGSGQMAAAVADDSGPSGLSSCEAAPGQLLVRFAERTKSSERASLRAAVHAKRVHAFHLLGLELVKTSIPVEQAAALLRSQRGVVSVERDCIVHIADAPDDPGFPQEWGLVNTGQVVDVPAIGPQVGTPGADIDAASAWAVRTDASSVTVAVIDTGIQLNHPDLEANLWTNTGETPGNGADDDGNGYIDDVHGWDFANDDATPSDDNGHGTHVSGTIGAIGDNGVGVTGVAWSVRIMPLKAFDETGSADTSAIIGALEYAVDNGAGISNNSYSGPSFVQAEFDAFAAAAEAGHLAIVAAGNEGQSDDAHPWYPAAFGLEEALSVAATDNKNVLASFSNFGSFSVHVAAPGVGILSTLPTSIVPSGYGKLSGTSMATPHVVGVAALVAAEHPTWTGAEVRDRILGTTRHVAALDGKTWTGGVVDAGAALSSDPTILPTAPLIPTLDLEAGSDTGSSPTDNVTRAASLTFDVTFPRSVTGLGILDFAVGGSAIGCVKGDPTGSGAAYVVVLTGCSPGSVVLAVKAGSVTDAVDDTPGPPVLIRGRSVLVDRTAPTGSAPSASLHTGAALAGSALPLRLKWTVSDGGGIDRYELARSLNGSATWTLLSAPSTTVDLTAASSGTVRYRSRAIDLAGNVGAWAYGPTLTPRLIQQTSTAIHRHGTWTSSSFASFSGGSARYARSSTASATYTFTGRGIALVSTRATTRGKVRVYINGAYAGIVDLYGPTQYRTVAWQKTWSTVATRTIKLVLTGTPGRPRVDLDAFAVLR
jgi:subtilisin family serine protease